MTIDPMSALEFRGILARLELSQLAAAQLLGVSHRSAQGWALGQVQIPAATAILLRLLADGVISDRQIRRQGYAKLALT